MSADVTVVVRHICIATRCTAGFAEYRRTSGRCKTRARQAISVVDLLLHLHQEMSASAQHHAGTADPLAFFTGKATQEDFRTAEELVRYVHDMLSKELASSDIRTTLRGCEKAIARFNEARASGVVTQDPVGSGRGGLSLGRQFQRGSPWASVCWSWSGMDRSADADRNTSVLGEG